MPPPPPCEVSLFPRHSFCALTEYSVQLRCVLVAGVITPAGCHSFLVTLSSPPLLWRGSWGLLVACSRRGVELL